MNYTATGKIRLLRHPSNPQDVVVMYNIEQSFDWQINELIENTLECDWQIESGYDYWYRIEAKCFTNSCDSNGVWVGDNTDQCYQTLVFSIMAKNLSDLCEKLKNPTFIYKFPNGFKIRSVKRFSKPAYRNRSNNDDNCNNLVLQNLSGILECLNFTVDEELTVSMGMFTFILVSEEYEASGGITLFGTIGEVQYEYISKSLCGAFTFAFTTEFDIGKACVQLSGSADCISSYYTIELSGEINLSGNANITSQYWDYVSTGGLNLNSQAIIEYDNYQYSGSGNLQVSSTSGSLLKINWVSYLLLYLEDGADYEWNGYNYEGSGIISLLGNAILGQYQTEGSGLINLSGESDIISSHFDYSSSGQIDLTGSYQIGFILDGSGGLNLSSSALQELVMSCISTGSLLISGIVDIVSSYFQYEGHEGITVSGHGKLGTYEENLRFIYMGMDIITSNLNILDEELEFTGITELENTVTTTCGCNPISKRILFQHNLTKNNSLLKYFLSRNRLNLDEQFYMNYSNSENIWKRIFNFEGLGNQNNQEKWKLNFNWSCTNLIAGVDLSTPQWLLSILIERKNLTNGDDFYSRFLYSVIQDSACIDEIINVQLNINVVTSEVQTSALLDFSKFEDGIKLFNNKEWYYNNILKFNVSETELDLETKMDRYDIKPIFSENLGLRSIQV